MHSYVIIDCGTNTFHLNKWQVLPEGSLHLVHAERIPVFIWPEPSPHGYLFSNLAMERMVEAFQQFKSHTQGIKPQHCLAVGTAAFRKALNAEQIQNQLFKATGIRMITLSGQDEAYWISQGIISVHPKNSINGLIMDIGGGSTEFIHVQHSEPLACFSFNAGVSLLKERFPISTIVNENSLITVLKFLDDLMTPLLKLNLVSEVLYGAAGVFETFQELAATRYLNSTDLLETSLVLQICKDVFESTEAERNAWLGLIPMRRSTILQSALLLHWVFTRISLKHLKIETAALKEGLIFGLVHERFKNIRPDSHY